MPLLGRPARVFLLLPVLALLLGALGPFAAGSVEAQETHTVPHDWPLIPKDARNEPLFAPGQKFRLLFISTVTNTARRGGY